MTTPLSADITSSSKELEPFAVEGK
jgi:hypothetical protein